MATTYLKRSITIVLGLTAAALLVTSLLFLSKTTQNSAEFGRLQNSILLVNVIGVLILIVLIVLNLVDLVRQYRQHTPGARLTARMVTMFVVLAVAPLGLVYYFSLQFITRDIDSWFDVEIEAALDDSLLLSRTALENRKREYLARVQNIAGRVQGLSGPGLVAALDQVREETGAEEMTVVGPDNQILATSGELHASRMPLRPTDEIRRQTRQGRPYVSLDPTTDGGFQVRIAVNVPTDGMPAGGMFEAFGAGVATDDGRILHALVPIDDQEGALAEGVQAAYSRYRELAFLRGPLKYSFTLTLTLALLLSLLTAVWGAFFWSRRLVSPIQDLVAGTRAVAKGDFDTRLPVPRRDEIGFLVNSFNEMTRRLAEAREQAEHSRQQVENERANLAVILARLSTGVVALESDLRLRAVNQAAGSILGHELERHIGARLNEIGDASPMAAQFVEVCRGHLENGDSEWREQLVLRGDVGRRVLMCACTALPGEADKPSGFVVVFDDITALIQAQRDAAWGEVARRLAHEIKNPLTPIQLSAERMRHRFLEKMEREDAQVLERSTHTIIHQVEAMKDMVNAFSEYARAPDVDLTSFDLNMLVHEVAELYRTLSRTVPITLDLDSKLPMLEADRGRVRQILHNLIRNALEALEGQPDGKIEIATRHLVEQGHGYVDIFVADNGPGFQRDIVEQVFDPYVTSKPKGTGLGLAIVKKLVEEHGGRIYADNRRAGGARISIRLPMDEDSRAAMLSRVAQPLENRREHA